MVAKTYQQFKKKLLKGKEVKKSYDELEAEFFLIELAIKKRNVNGFNVKISLTEK